MLAGVSPEAILTELLDLVVVDVLLEIVELRGKNSEATNAQAIQDVDEDLRVETAVINHTRHDDELKSAMIVLGNFDTALAENKTLQLLVRLLLLGDGQQVVTAVDSRHIVEALFLEILASVSLTTANFEHLSLEWVLAAQISHHACANFRREASLDELVLIVGADAVKVLLEGRLREHLERPLFASFRALNILGFLLIVEDLPEVLDGLAESGMEVGLLK